MFSQNTTILAWHQAGTLHPRPWLGGGTRGYVHMEALLYAHALTLTPTHISTVLQAQSKYARNSLEDMWKLQIYSRCKKTALIQFEQQSPLLGAVRQLKPFWNQRWVSPYETIAPNLWIKFYKKSLFFLLFERKPGGTPSFPSSFLCWQLCESRWRKRIGHPIHLINLASRLGLTVSLRCLFAGPGFF